jgi:hypothetical protein
VEAKVRSISETDTLELTAKRRGNGGQGRKGDGRVLQIHFQARLRPLWFAKLPGGLPHRCSVALSRRNRGDSYRADLALGVAQYAALAVRWNAAQFGALGTIVIPWSRPCTQVF